MPHYEFYCHAGSCSAHRQASGDENNQRGRRCVTSGGFRRDFDPIESCSV